MKKNKGEPHLWREANYYIGCLFIVVFLTFFIVVFLTFNVLYQFKITFAKELNGYSKPLISPVPDSYLGVLNDSVFVQIQPIPTPTPEEIKVEETITELTEFYGNKFEVEPSYLRCIIWFESRNDAEAVGDSGKAVGLCQFHLGTFLGFRKQMGLSQEDLRRDKAESVKVLAWAISKNYDHHWSVVNNNLCRK